MYHDALEGPDLDASGFPGHGPARYKVAWTTFVEHLDRVATATGRSPLGVDDLLAAGGPGDGSWLLTFDDGGASAVPIAKELTRRGWRGHFFVTTDRIGTPGFVDRSGVAELARLGHVVGSHSCSHPPRISELDPAALFEEWRRSCAVLSDIVGAEVRTGSVPGGFASAPVRSAAASAGMRALFTSEPVRRVHTVDGCAMIGRFAVMSDTSAEVAAGLAAGRAWPAGRQRIGWTARKAAKAVGGRRYLQLRSAIVARRH